MFKLLLLVAVASFIGGGKVLCGEININSAQELIELSNSVNKGTVYTGTTVFLDNDLDFSGEYSEQFAPVGYDSSNYFNGVFDGQGHTISNLKLNSSSQYVGLFGYSEGTTIQNVVIDGSCSFVSSYSSSNYPFIGSIIGYCSSTKGSCIIESVVNMASVSFDGNVTGNLYIGGIVGDFYSSSSYPSTLKNCVNYGSVTHSGTGGSWVELGGIAGISEGQSESFNSIQNCLNYGTITHSGPSKSLAIGGIVGISYYAILDNCVNSGAISTNKESEYIGGIAGRIESYSEVTHCYSSSAANLNPIGEVKSSAFISNNRIFDKDTLDLDTPVTVGNTTTSSLIEALNAAAEHYTLRGYSRWLCNKDTKEVSFTVNGHRMSTTMASEIILLPSLASRGIGAVFSGWYTDSACTTPLAGHDVVDDTALYGKSGEDTNTYIISFDIRGGNTIYVPYFMKFGSVAALPKDRVTRKHCEFLGWETSYGDIVPYDFPVPRRDITLYGRWLCARITTASELIAFSRAVNNGRDFTGTTVLLDSDIDFSGGYSEQFVPMGYDSSNYFNGAFDGQGHTISNLKVNSPSTQSVGLYGYSQGTTIQNVVIDGSCSFVNTFSSRYYTPVVASTVGYCLSSKGSCVIESVVNMASVSFDGNVTKNLYIGGIAGYFDSSSYPNALRNCVNYGSVTHSGTCGNWVYLGGIIGYSYGRALSYISIQNCLNYGTITHSGSSTTLLIGGIAGISQYTSFDNCVNSGAISTNKESDYIGGVVGYVSSYSEVTHCFWTSGTGNTDAYGYIGFYADVAEPSLVTLNQTTLDELNEYASKESSWSKWVMLHLNGGRINNISQESLVEIQKHFPDPVREGNSFLFWCKDNGCREVFDPKTDSAMSLYAGWEINTVTFDLGNGTVVKESFPFNTSIEYPKDVVREGCALSWNPELLSMPAMDITIRAQWIPNNYTATFDLGNGTVVNESFTFNTVIEYPKDMVRVGHTLSWNPELLSMPAMDITIKAQWTPNNYTATFDLGNGTVVNETFTFNTVIEYPKDMVRVGHTLSWNPEPDLMPAMDIMITAQWKPIHLVSGSKSSKSSTNAIVGGTVGGIVGVVVVVLLALGIFLLLKRKSKDSRRNGDDVEMNRKNPRFVLKSVDNSPDANDCDDAGFVSIGDTIAKFYSDCYRIPTIAEALRTAGIDNERIKAAVDACKLAGDSALNEGKLADGFTKGDAASVALYTFDFGGDDFELNPYRIINKALVSNDERDLQMASGLLYLVISSLRRLPKCTGKSLYRGVRGGVDVSAYKDGSVVVWRGLSSTSPDMNVTKAFLARGSASGNVKGTLFVIENGWGYDIQPYSLFPDETEILLEPERRFRVEGVLIADLTVIKLRMLNTPLLLPEVFGENTN